MENRPVTIKDLARKLKMSVSTVSKALNNYPSISAMTKTRVQEMAREMKFTPNESAIFFKKQRTRTIGVIIPSLLDQFYVLAINGLEEYAMQNDYRVIICQSYENLEREHDLVEMMQKMRVEGLLIAISKETRQFDHLQRLEETGAPVVFFVREPSVAGAHAVTSNVGKAAFDAVEYLIGKGHRRIAHLKGPDSLITSQLRWQGYKEALKKHGIPYTEGLVATTDLSPGSTASAMQALMLAGEAPTAVLAFKDYVVLDAMRYMQQQHPALLPKIDFIGYGNISLLDYLTVRPEASLEEQPYAIGRSAMTLLLDLVNKKIPVSEYQRLQFDCKLILHNVE